jgi:hypothetical protein
MLACVKEDASAPYRVAPPMPPDPYLVAWADLRKRRTNVTALSVLLLLGALLWITLTGARVGPTLWLTNVAGPRASVRSALWPLRLYWTPTSRFRRALSDGHRRRLLALVGQAVGAIGTRRGLG